MNTMAHQCPYCELRFATQLALQVADLIPAPMDHDQRLPSVHQFRQRAGQARVALCAPAQLDDSNAARHVSEEGQSARRCLTQGSRFARLAQRPLS